MTQAAQRNAPCPRFHLKGITVEQNSNETPTTQDTPTGMETSAGAPTSSNAAETVSKPRRASRRVTTPTVDTAEVAAQAAESPKKRVSRARKTGTAGTADTAAGATADVPAAAEADAPAAKKPATKRRTAAQAKAEADAPTEPPAADGATEAAPKKTTRSRRAASSETAGAATAGSGSATEDGAAEKPKRQTRSRRAKSTDTAAASDDAANEAGSHGHSSDVTEQAASENTAEASAKKTRTRRAKRDDAASTGDGAGAEQTDAPSSQTAGGADANESNSGDEGDASPTRGRRGSRRAKNDAAEEGKGDADTSNEDAGDGSDSADKANDEQGGQRNTRREKSSRSRTRQRDRKRRNQNDDGDIELTEDDVLLPVAGILDVLENYAFVRTTGYLPGTNDVYVSLSQVKRHSLRKGDAVVGAIRQPREGDQNGRQKYNALVKIDSINGHPVDDGQKRDEFESLKVQKPEQRILLSEGASGPLARAIDLFAPVALGQRGVVSSAPGFDTTEVLSVLAESLSAQLPDAHLMYVSLGRGPEHVTELQRTVNGEVVAASSDHAPEDIVTVAELVFERAKRLVELGHDVVVLVDGFAQLSEAMYTLTPPQARNSLLGQDSPEILQIIRRMVGQARNIEHGGSLTIYGEFSQNTLLSSGLAPVATWSLAANFEQVYGGDAIDGIDLTQTWAADARQLQSEAEFAGVQQLRRRLVVNEMLEETSDSGPIERAEQAIALVRSAADTSQFLDELTKRLGSVQP